MYPRSATGRVIPFALTNTHVQSAHGALSLLIATSGGHTAAEGRALLEELVSVAAGATVCSEPKGKATTVLRALKQHTLSRRKQVQTRARRAAHR